MGLMGFWKNKASDQSKGPSINDQAQQPFSDLPAIDGFSADKFESSSVQDYSNQLPSLDDSAKPDGSKSLSFNVPTFDFSLPPSDDEPVQSAVNTTPSTDTLAPPTPPPEAEHEPVTISPEDLNNLFVSDSEWKEPDWNNFDPYPEEKIEEPTASDFGETDLPAFDDNAEDNTIQAEPLSEPAKPFRDDFSPLPKPMELFIRGRAYSRVFIELDQMNKTLDAIDSQLDKYEEMLKREEPLMNQAKDQMEYLYRRLNQIDKKVFTQ